MKDKTPFEKAGYTKETRFRRKKVYQLHRDDCSNSPTFFDGDLYESIHLRNLEVYTEFDKKQSWTG